VKTTALSWRSGLSSTAKPDLRSRRLHPQRLRCLPRPRLPRDHLLLPKVAHLIRERRFHVSQQVTEVGKGVRLKMGAAGLPEIAAWVAGFGGEARVVAPGTVSRTRVDRNMVP